MTMNTGRHKENRPYDCCVIILYIILIPIIEPELPSIISNFKFSNRMELENGIGMDGMDGMKND